MIRVVVGHVFLINTTQDIYHAMDALYEGEFDYNDTMMHQEPDQDNVMTDVFASAGVVPNGYAVVDTACLRGCGGDVSIDQYVHSRGMTEVIKASDMSFKGINDTAPMKSGGEQEIMVGISGVGCTLRLQRLPQSSTPMLMSIGQLQQMGAVIDLVNHRIDFKTLGVETPI